MDTKPRAEEGTGIGRDNHGADVEFLGEASGVDGACAAESDEGEGAGVVAAFDGYLADGVGHAGVHDVDDALGGLLGGRGRGGCRRCAALRRRLDWGGESCRHRGSVRG